MIVSVAVITYNSSKTVIDTLDSISKQSYGSKNIELIISDDASTDDTVDIIESWLSIYKNFFYKVLFIKNPINLGVSGNINTAWKEVSSEWVKSIAGDDLLDEQCIELNVEFVKEHSNCKILFSKMQLFGISDTITPTPYDIRFFKKQSKQQYNWLRNFGFNIAPSAFISINLLKRVSYADEKYRMIEDLPLWLKITKSGCQLQFLDAVTVFYRADESVTISKERYINTDFTKDLISVLKDNRGKFFTTPIAEWLLLEQILNYRAQLLVSTISGNRHGRISRAGTYFLRLLKPAHSVRSFLFMTYNKYHIK